MMSFAELRRSEQAGTATGTSSALCSETGHARPISWRGSRSAQALLLGAQAMLRKVTRLRMSNEHGGSTPLLDAPTGSNDDSCSTMLRATVQSDGSDELSASELAAPTTGDQTRTSASLADPRRAPVLVEPRPLPPSTPTQVRDPERYQILGEHGRGGLGRVSRAHDRELSRDVAIKELISRGHVSEVRFLREALITARLEHPGIVPVHEAGRWPDGTPFYAMKLVSGRSLRDLIAERATVEERLGLLHHVIAVADAIAYAHGRNIIHRDLKPANVIVGDFGETIVIDWGLAKDLTATEEPLLGGGPFRSNRDDELTAAGTVLGTPTYMAPEQERGDQVDQRADVFAIGAMLWQLCSLQKVPPIDARHRSHLLRRAGIDRDLSTIIDKALDRDPERRYPDAGALAADLKSFKSGARIAARDYSLLAVLAHWTRRHRAVALTVAIAATIVVSGVILYIYSVEAESKRADNALATAQRERDRSQLSEASLLLEKDPTRAKDLLASLALRSAQHSLLASRAKQGAALLVVPVIAGIQGMFRTSNVERVGLLNRDGELHEFHLADGSTRIVGVDVERAVTWDTNAWLYMRKAFGDRAANIVSSEQSMPLRVDIGDLSGIVKLLALNRSIYALDASRDLYMLSSNPPLLVKKGVRSVAGDGNLLLTCSLDGVLEVISSKNVVLSQGCGQIRSLEPIAVAQNDYAVLNDRGTLIVSRGGRTLEIPTNVAGEYELSLSTTGVLALADYGDSGKPWFLRPFSRELTLGPSYSSELHSVAAGGSLAAWGYANGTVIVLETRNGVIWELKGHPAAVSSIVIDDRSSRIVSTSANELRVWNLRVPPIKPVGSMPCRAFNMQISADRTKAAFDCDDGTVWVWTLGSNELVQVHKHASLSFGVQWLRDRVCSSGWDGRVLCSNPQGGDTRVFDTDAGRVMWLTSSDTHEFLLLATVDGRVWKLDNALHELYSQGAIPYRVAASSSGALLATCGFDGSVVIFDLEHGRKTRQIVHDKAIHSLAWVGDELWTSSADGTLRQWRIQDTTLHSVRTIRMFQPFRLTKVFSDGWVANVGEGMLVIARGPSQVPLRLQLGKQIYAIEVSPDQRYVAASVLGEVLVVDMKNNRLATVPMRTKTMSYINLEIPDSMVVLANNSIQITRLEDLEYTTFADPWLHNRGVPNAER